MKQTFLLFAVLIVLFSCNTEEKKNYKEEIVRNFIEYLNNGESEKVDSITTPDFKYLTDTSVAEKSDYLKNVTKPVANAKIQIVEIETSENIVKTKEKITDDIIDYLDLKPIERKREYHFNDSNLIKSIYNLEQFESPDYIKIQKKLILWANQEYPDFVQKMIGKAKNGENIDEERRYLLTKLKNRGLQVLDSVSFETVKKEEPTEETKSGGSFISPNGSFLNSVVITYFGMNAFPFGEYTVQEFKDAVAGTVMTNGKNPIIKGWTKNDNIYTLHVNYQGETVKFVFIHLLNKEGKGSEMYGMINGERIDGVQMYQLVPSLIK
ncbi:MAG: hypothetical protein JXL97_03265 [Bacteroidales bacterium]|nr:hypothetical protein [Bacteroidales bacterium]